jgi:flavin reductase (DIM6/NTAB) family NADH-FMN oxidoreductase RutF
MSRTQIKVPVSLERSLYLLHPYTASLVTCKGKNGKNNVMAAAWIIPISVDPPMLAMSIRPERYSYDLIRESREFVVNIPSFQMAKGVLICGRISGRDHNKFKEARFSIRRATKLQPPIIEQCVAHIECKVVKVMKTGDHSLILGKIVAASALEGYFELVYDLTRFNPCLHLGKNYFTTCVKRRREPKVLYH